MIKSHRLVHRLKFLGNMAYDATSRSASGIKLQDVVQQLNELAPLSLAESWDNIGLLVEPTSPHNITKMLLTNDLTEPVLEEAIAKKANMILSYHPPIFSPLKRLTCASVKERIVIRCLENRIAVYSPHTCYDALKGGVNDWLSQAFEISNVKPIQASMDCPRFPLVGKIRVPQSTDISVNEIFDISNSGNMEIHKTARPISGEDSSGYKVDLDFTSNEKGMEILSKTFSDRPEIIRNLEVTKQEKLPSQTKGMGRICQLKEPITIAEAINRVKAHLDLTFVQVAIGKKKTKESKIKSVALCAGSGASILRNVPADLYFTGEMSHHEVLDAVSKGISVILCNHSNTERGFLKDSLTQTLSVLFLEKVEVIMSEVDADPLVIM